MVWDKSQGKLENCATRGGGEKGPSPLFATRPFRCLRAKLLVGRGVPAEPLIAVFPLPFASAMRLAGDGSPHRALCAKRDNGQSWKRKFKSQRCAQGGMGAFSGLMGRGGMGHDRRDVREGSPKGGLERAERQFCNPLHFAKLSLIGNLRIFMIKRHVLSCAP